jgi:hypothetical protein
MVYTNEQRNAYNRKYYHENKEKTQAYNNRKCEKAKAKRRLRRAQIKCGLIVPEPKQDKQKKEKKEKTSTPPPPIDENDIYGYITVDKGLFVLDW